MKLENLQPSGSFKIRYLTQLLSIGLNYKLVL